MGGQERAPECWAQVLGEGTGHGERRKKAEGPAQAVFPRRVYKEAEKTKTKHC